MTDNLKPIEIDTQSVSSIHDATAKPKTSDDLTLGIGAALREMRRRKRMTQEDVASKVGLERTSITNIEKGKQKISVFHLARYANALGVELHITFKDKQGGSA